MKQQLSSRVHERIWDFWKTNIRHHHPLVVPLEPEMARLNQEYLQICAKLKPGESPPLSCEGVLSDELVSLFMQHIQSKKLTIERLEDKTTPLPRGWLLLPYVESASSSSSPKTKK